MQGLPVAGVSTAMQARQILDENGCDAGGLKKFPLLCSCKASLPHETTDHSVLPSTAALTKWLVCEGRNKLLRIHQLNLFQLSRDGSVHLPASLLKNGPVLASITLLCYFPDS